MARSVLADGRALDAARMIEPLIDGEGKAFDGSDVLLRCLLARVRLLTHGDVDGTFQILGAYEILSNRRMLDPAVRGEAALWLGWAHVLDDGPHYDDARALNLLDEAAGIFREETNVPGLFWTLVGQAQAYLTIDEYQLMLQATDEASTLQEKLKDIQAAIWMTDLSVTAGRYRGRYDAAKRDVAEMLSLAETCGDEISIGRAHAHQAVLAYEIGQPPSTIIAEAERAEAILNRGAGRAGRALLAAYDAHIGALVRLGDWEEAEKFVDVARLHIGARDTDASAVRLHRARILTYRGDHDRAESELDDLRTSTPRRSSLIASRIAVLFSDLMLRRKRLDAAREWADRAYLLARETGYESDLLRALLQMTRVSVLSEDISESRRHLRETEAYGHYFNLLPLAAEQFDVQAQLSVLRKRPDEARTLLTQAISTWSMIADAYGMARSQYDLARLTRTSAPGECRPLAEGSLKTFERLGSRREVRRLRDLVRALPGKDGAAEHLSETEIASVLSRSALSIELVAETWLRLAERIAPDRWMGVFRYDEKAGWSSVRTHGEDVIALHFPDPHADRLCEQGVDWIRLKTVLSSTFFFAMECGGEDDPACRVIENRLSAWVPVAGLAFEHALLRVTSTANANGSHATDSDRHFELEGLVYAGESMRGVVGRIHRIRSSHSPVLITGERGVGKNLIAACIHQTSDRRSTRFVEFDCSTTSRTRFEQQLFGEAPPDEDGSDSMESRSRDSASLNCGALGLAHDGTLFLDAIDEMPLEVQPRFLSFLERGEISYPAFSEPVKLNVRIIASTSQNLHGLVAGGRFLEDLCLRLNVVPLRIPPLRHRRNEIPLLVQHFLRTLQAGLTRRATLSARALEAMMRYDWPGNARQLRNEIERALVFTQSEPAPVIDVDDLSEPVAAALSRREPFGAPNVFTAESLAGYALDDILASAEKSVIERALAGHDGQVSAAAETLGLTRQGLYKKMKRLGIDASRFQSGVDFNSAVQ